MFDPLGASRPHPLSNAAIRSLGEDKHEENFHCIKPTPFQRTKFDCLADRLAPAASPNKAGGPTEADLYEDNSGTSLTIALGDRLIIASDTRHSAEYNINTRSMSRIFRIGHLFLSTTGFYADAYEVFTRLQYEIKQYETHRKITIKAAAHLLHNILYARRFFPYYTYVCISAIENKEAIIYSYDPIGSYEKVPCRCDGSSAKMIQPLLDSWIDGKNFANFTPLGFENVVDLVKKAFDSAAEVDVKTKDAVEIYTVSDSDVQHEIVALRSD